MVYYFAAVLVMLHLYIAWRTQLMINQTPLLNTFQRRFSTILNWMIPLIWSWVVR